IDAIGKLGRLPQAPPDLLPACIPGLGWWKRARPDEPRVVIGIHENRIQAPQETLPHPPAVCPDSEDVIGVRYDDFTAVRNWRIVAVLEISWRDPVCRAA